MRDTLRSAMLHANRLGRGSRLRAATLLQRMRDGGQAEDAAQADQAPPRDPVLDAALAAHAGRILTGSYVNAAGTRPYRLYVPRDAVRHPAGPPLLVMLHGCHQNPDDFAAGTRMNEHADERGWLVLYPGQSTSANHSGCWNWFNHGDQRRGAGEPSLIAGMTQEVMQRWGVDPARVYVAGLSAGGTMAATMASTYPDVYAACGVHSGLPHAAAHDLMSALQAMRQGAATAVPGAMLLQADGVAQRAVPTIVFHGDRDSVVHPCNGDGVIAQAHARVATELRALAMAAEPTGRVPGGHAWTRTVHRDADGRTVSEQWVVHGSGHAWSGGSSRGSYTDPLGPDASAEMLRFFAEHPHR